MEESRFSAGWVITISQPIYHGRDRSWNRPGDDYVHVVNEDLGFNASLVTAVNTTFETTIPYPQEWDPEDEVMIINEFEHRITRESSPSDDAFTNALHIFLSMIDRAASATFIGNLADSEDEFYKSQFEGPMYAGRSESHTSPAASAVIVPIAMGAMRHSVLRPRVRIPTFFPIFAEYYTDAVAVADDTGAVTAATFAIFEAVNMKYWYEIRRMNSRERKMLQGMPGVQQRWAQLGA